MARWLVAALVLALLHAAPAPATGAAQDLSPNVLLPRVFAYVDRFHEAFGAAVSEERYEQVLRQGSVLMRGTDARVILRSDFLLVNVLGQGWLPFRDVFEANGRQLRDREDRLAGLFLKGATDDALRQARRVMDEGSRYNLGNGTRNINVPTLIMMFLSAEHRRGLTFTIGKPDDDPAGRIMTFVETGRPTLISTTGQRDLPVEGRIWVDEATGAILRAEVTAADVEVESHVSVTFARHEGFDVLVPARMEERFKRRRDATETRGVATYGRFRRFSVSANEDIALPPEP